MTPATNRTNSSDSPVLRIAGRPVGRYLVRPELPGRLSPHPYLHPVTTLAGTAVTERSPADHAPHLGVGVAVPDVEGFNFWGGRTHVRDQGPTELDNHGAQRHVGFPLRDPDGFVEELRWVAAGNELLRERRGAAARRGRAHAWLAPGGRARLWIEIGAGARCRFSYDVGDGRRPSGQVFAATPWRWVGALIGLVVLAPVGGGHAGAATFTRFRSIASAPVSASA
ncbi:DUF6807 family protein [Streptomyces avermitilis]|uniref:DUF6807 family protein n=1 Tax=Streptomyces avermitilis TaxID=33903 RepID=UPI0033B64799